MIKNDIYKKQLEELYKQKKSIDAQIEQLEKKILHNKSLEKKDFSKNEKIELFKSLFIGRFDIYAKKWLSQDKTKQGFYPVTRTFRGEDYVPITNKDVENHLRGKIFLATYCIDNNNMSKFIAFNILDEDKFKFQTTLNSLNIRAYYELNSYNSIISWIFFEELIPSSEAYHFAQYIIKKANISAKIYPNKNFASKHNLGVSLELPLHLEYRNKNKTIFIDSNTNKIYQNQWLILNNVQKVSRQTVLKYFENSNMLQVAKDFTNIKIPLNTINMFLEDYIYIETKDLTKGLIKNLKSFASFDNPQIKLLLSLRKPLYNTPKVIKSFEEDDKYLMLPRGLLLKIKSLFDKNQVKYEIDDRRIFEKTEIKKVKFILRPEQENAIRQIKKYDFSICVAPPGFGKTLIGAKIIEDLSCKTLVVVNKNMLLDQWIERFIQYFDYEKTDIGFLGKGKNKLNSNLDVATMQSLKNSPEFINNYSLIIVDECHHIPAVTFEQIIKNFKGKYILGLSATPNRKDGLEPILYQQLGEISYEYKKKRTNNNKLKVVRTNFTSSSDNYASLINELCVDKNRNELILKTIKENLSRKILLLTDRIEHINILEQMLSEQNIDFVAIHGSMNKKEQVENMNLVQEKSLILATTSYFGEGIDFPHLNTILFATPISYYGRLIQYLGRIGRGNQDCLAIDFLDSKNAMLNSAYKKRLEGYSKMYYK